MSQSSSHAFVRNILFLQGDRAGRPQSPIVAVVAVVVVVVVQSCLTLFDPVDGRPPGSSVHGILQEKYWSRLPFPSPGKSSQPRD